MVVKQSDRIFAASRYLSGREPGLMMGGKSRKVKILIRCWATSSQPLLQEESKGENCGEGEIPAYIRILWCPTSACSVRVLLIEVRY